MSFLDSLFHAAKCGHGPEAEFVLTEYNADPNMTDKRNKTPLALATDSKTIKILLKYGAQASNVYTAHSKEIGKLSSERSPEIPLPILITGDAGVGKSTFLKSMLSSRGFWAFLSKAEPVLDVDEKTVGIIPHEIETKEFGKILCHDFAGQQEFYASHCAVLENAIQTSPPIILYVADLNRVRDEQKATNSIARWMSMVQNHCSNLRDKAHVIVIGSHADILTKNKEDPWNRERIFSLVIEKFPQFVFKAFIPMDCRYPETNEMKEAKKVIQNSSAILRSPETISLNAHTFYIYLLDNFSDTLTVSLKNVQQKIHRDLDRVESEQKKNLLSFIPSTLPHLIEICHQLNKTNLILYLHNETSPEKSYIICDRATLLSNITGTIFAPKDFRQHCNLASSTGVVALSKFSEHFKGYNIDMLIAFMCRLELCHEIIDKEVLEYLKKIEENLKPCSRYFFFPGLIRIETPDKIWEEDSTMKCHFGWIIECSHDLEFFDPRCLQVLILRLVATFDLAPTTELLENIPTLHSRYCSVWKNGIFWRNEDGINSYLELMNNGKTIVLKMRSRDLKPEFVIVRSQIIAKVLEAIRNFCSSITIIESVINPYELIRRPINPELKPILFNISDIAVAVVDKKADVSTSAKHKSLTLTELLQFEPYACFDQNIFQCICSERNAEKNEKVSDIFLAHFVYGIIDTGHFNNMLVTLLESDHFARVFMQPGSPKQTPFHALKTWRDKTEGTYKCLKETLSQYSIFAGRNPLVRAVIVLELILIFACFSTRIWLVSPTVLVILQLLIIYPYQRISTRK